MYTTTTEQPKCYKQIDLVDGDLLVLDVVWTSCLVLLLMAFLVLMIQYIILKIIHLSRQMPHRRPNVVSMGYAFKNPIPIANKATPI